MTLEEISKELEKLKAEIDEWAAEVENLKRSDRAP